MEANNIAFKDNLKKYAKNILKKAVEESKAEEAPKILILHIRYYFKQYPTAINCQENP